MATILSELNPIVICSSNNGVSINMNDILQKIVTHKRQEIDSLKKRFSFEAVEETIPMAPPVRDFTQALRDHAPMGLIAEVKKASPSAGIIREDFDPVKTATTYQQHGAACVSVLTDEHFFQGCLDYLIAIRGQIDLPILRKDFILDRYQIAEARSAGADAVLLIAECLNETELNDLFNYTKELGMEALVELYEPENLSKVLALNPTLVGVNNRNLRTFVTDLNHSIEVKKQVPDSVMFVSESGIRNRDNVESLMTNNVHAMLVGETIMRADDMGTKIDELLNWL